MDFVKSADRALLFEEGETVWSPSVHYDETTSQTSSDYEKFHFSLQLKTLINKAQLDCSSLQLWCQMYQLREELIQKKSEAC